MMFGGHPILSETITATASAPQAQQNQRQQQRQQQQQQRQTPQQQQQAQTSQTSLLSMAARATKHASPTALLMPLMQGSAVNAHDGTDDMSTRSGSETEAAALSTELVPLPTADNNDVGKQDADTNSSKAARDDRDVDSAETTTSSSPGTTNKLQDQREREGEGEGEAEGEGGRLRHRSLRMRFPRRARDSSESLVNVDSIEQQADEMLNGIVDAVQQLRQELVQRVHQWTGLLDDRMAQAVGDVEATVSGTLKNIAGHVDATQRLREDVLQAHQARQSLSTPGASGNANASQ